LNDMARFRVHCERRTSQHACRGFLRERRESERTLNDRREHVELPDEHDDAAEDATLPFIDLDDDVDDRLRESRCGRASAGSCTMPCLGQRACVVWLRGKDCSSGG